MLEFFMGIFAGDIASFLLFAMLTPKRLTPEEALERARMRILQRKEENLETNAVAALEDSHCIDLLNEVFEDL